MNTPVLHITRGTLGVDDLDAARAGHNRFVGEGEPPGIEIARSLGDLSHNVFVAVDSGDLVFVDFWADTPGMEQFFANPFAQQAGDRLYASREEAEWHLAPGAFTFQVPAPVGAAARYIGTMRATVSSADKAVTLLGELVAAKLTIARRRGQLSHHLYLRTSAHPSARPAANTHRAGGLPIERATPEIEVLALDTWTTPEGLHEHYDDGDAMHAITDALTSPPTTSVWTQINGFTEW